MCPYCVFGWLYRPAVISSAEPLIHADAFLHIKHSESTSLVTRSTIDEPISRCYWPLQNTSRYCRSRYHLVLPLRESPPPAFQAALPLLNAHNLSMTPHGNALFDCC